MLTIAIPTYNRPTELIETLKNLHCQTNKNFMIVISDNCSDYDVKSMIDREFDIEFKEKIQCYQRQVNVGADNNIIGTFGLVASGWLWICSDDNFIYPDAVEKAHKYIEAYGDSSIIQVSVDKTYQNSEWCFSRVEDFVDVLYPKVNRKTANSIWGDLCSCYNKLYNVDQLKTCLSMPYMHAYCCMSTTLVVLSALMENHKVIFCQDNLFRIEGTIGWSMSKVALKSSTVSHVDFGVDKRYENKLMNIINFPYKLLLHYWLDPHNHFNEGDYVKRLYYGFYQYHLPLKERLDYLINMKLFSISFIYRLHLKISGIERVVRKKYKKK